MEARRREGKTLRTVVRRVIRVPAQVAFATGQGRLSGVISSAPGTGHFTIERMPGLLREFAEFLLSSGKSEPREVKARMAHSRLAIETHTIDYVPPEDRHGHPGSLFSIWWSANMQITTVVTGTLAVIFGIPFVWALLAIVVGNALGGVFMAYHSAQGPVIGIPQMIQSRAQFGFYGAVLPLALVIVMYIGFFATSELLGAQALHSAAPALAVDVGTAILAAAAALLAIYGYDLIHQYERIVAYLFLIAFAILTIRAFTDGLIVAKTWQAGTMPWGPFFLMLSVAATWQITYAPYVADYSRYLPQSVRMEDTFWYTYLGSVLASIWMMGLGALLATILPKTLSDAVGTLANLAGPLTLPVLILIVLGVLAVNVLNLYGGFMSSLTTLGAIFPIRGGRVTRVAFVAGVAVIGTLIAILGQGHFLTNYSNFLLFLLYFMVPWTAINLTDFYLVRRGKYSHHAFFEPSGPYGGVRWNAVVAYLVGFGVELPFMNTTLLVGPIAKLLGGADVSWVIGIVVAGAIYFFTSARERVAAIEAEGVRA